ncbi:uncharacterized protein LOC107609833 isoform X2 [Arachis ipaensis]|uniref:uncharacterized protein LOC107609833 isoform X2 n=1 Tax=Arachis ipaensis TaxID=130454 RepID=UPI0007AFB699|nr:uncharacterized protein LOC107609833 isoform X2 [Arachis ipaensis]XP_025667842.1 uncharacterized protein LOC112766177 isoform X5 [Arachis hypogaea]QHN92513.1 uncharacterized protein DS421_17g584400 [Arachis hypogaea]
MQLTLDCTVELILGLVLWTTFVFTPWLVLPWIKQLRLLAPWLRKQALPCKYILFYIEQHMKKGGRLIQSEEHLVISSQMPIKTDGPAQVTPAKEKMQIKTQAEDKASQSIFLGPEAEAWTLPSFFPANYKCCADFLKWVFMMMLQIFGGGSSSS